MEIEIISRLLLAGSVAEVPNLTLKTSIQRLLLELQDGRANVVKLVAIPDQ